MYDNIGLFVCLLACFKHYKSDNSTLPVIVALSLLFFTFLLHTLTYLDIDYRTTILKFAEIDNVVLAVFGVFAVSLVMKLQQSQSQKEKAIYQLLDLEKNTTSILEIKVEERTLKIREQSEILLKQADEISRMNELLSVDNRKLKVDIEEVTQAHVMNKNASYEDFLKYYPDSEACFKFLHNFKKEKNFTFKCSKCSNLTGSLMVPKYSTRCSRCGYMEPITHYTIYYNVKFPLNKAFYLTYLVSTNQVYTLDKISTILDLRKQTCLTFINRIKNIKQASRSITPGSEGWYNLILTF